MPTTDQLDGVLAPDPAAKKPFRLEEMTRSQGWRWYGTYKTLEAAKAAMLDYWFPKASAARIIDRRTSEVAFERGAS